MWGKVDTPQAGTESTQLHFHRNNFLVRTKPLLALVMELQQAGAAPKTLVRGGPRELRLRQLL